MPVLSVYGLSGFRVPAVCVHTLSNCSPFLVSDIPAIIYNLYSEGFFRLLSAFLRSWRLQWFQGRLLCGRYSCIIQSNIPAFLLLLRFRICSSGFPLVFPFLPILAYSIIVFFNTFFRGFCGIKSVSLPVLAYSSSFLRWNSRTNPAIIPVFFSFSGIASASCSAAPALIASACLSAMAASCSVNV